MDATNGTDASKRRVPRGAVLGVLVGCTAWALAFSVLVLAMGRVELLVECVLPVVLSSVVVALLLLALLQWKWSLPKGAPGADLLVPAGVWCALGLLLVVADGYVTPVLEADSRFADAVRATGGVLRMPIWLSLVALLVGGAMLAVALRRIARANG